MGMLSVWHLYGIIRFHVSGPHRQSVPVHLLWNPGAPAYMSHAFMFQKNCHMILLRAPQILCYAFNTQRRDVTARLYRRTVFCQNA